MKEVKKINTKNVVWWINHLFNDYAQYARNKGYTKQADEVEDVRETAVAAVKAYYPKEEDEE